MPPARIRILELNDDYGARLEVFRATDPTYLEPLGIFVATCGDVVGFEMSTSDRLKLCVALLTGLPKNGPALTAVRNFKRLSRDG